MKKKLMSSICCCMLIIMCLAGCNGKVPKEEQTGSDYENAVYTKMYYKAAKSDIGAIWVKEDGSHICFTPKNSDEEMVFCFNPNCSHPETSADNPDPECMAALYHSYRNNEVAYYNGAIYIFAMENLGECTLYKMDVNGSNREMVGVFPFETYCRRACIFYNDRVYLSATVLKTDLENDEDEKEDGMATVKRLQYDYTFAEINLTDKTYRFIGEDFDGSTYVAEIDLMGPYLYARLSDMEDDGRIYEARYNLETSEAEVVISKDEWASGIRYIVHYDDDSYYYWDKNESMIAIRNIDGTVEKIVLKGPAGERFGASVSCDGMMYTRSMEYEGEQPGRYFMDFETGEITDITEPADKYGFCEYDGYYGVFLGEHVDGKNSKYHIWDREMILSEAKK